MRLRRFLMRDPMAAGTVAARSGYVTFAPWRRAAASRVESPRRVLFGGGVTAARGPLESQVEVRNLAPERSSTKMGQRRKSQIQIDRRARSEEEVPVAYRPLSAVVLAAG